ncbi:MAG: hypothetical protein LW817_07955 [Candidatus Caenarcaniphilales bacterium]|jgi:hypothetical protein|nr:hypothetical protein [Candidatus Caenarcaniphilales bacterium]
MNNQNGLILSHDINEIQDGLRDIIGYQTLQIPLWLQILFYIIIVSAILYWLYIKLWVNRKQASISIYELVSTRLKKLDLSLESKKFYLEYSELVKKYLEERLGLAILDKTAEELKEILSKDPKIQTTIAISLSKIFARADLAKFAKQDINFENKSQDILVTLQILNTLEDAIVAEEKAIEEAKKNNA